MKSKKLLRIIVAMVLIITIISVIGLNNKLYASDLAESTITIAFKDKNLYYYITESYEIEEMECEKNDSDLSITMEESELQKVTGLFLANEQADRYCRTNIKNLEGIDKFVNLSWLGIEGADIEDYSPLKNLKKLKSLNLYDTNFEDMEFIRSLPILEDISFTECNISDISWLEGLTNLKSLSLQRNNIENITYLSNLTNLETLNLWDNKISDISALSSLKELKELNLGNNKINNISVLSNLKDLEKLDLRANKIRDISVLNQLNNLKEIDTRFQNITLSAKAGETIKLPKVKIKKITTSNATVNSSKTKVKITNNQKKKKATIKISGGPLDGSTYTITIKPNSTKITKISTKNKKISLNWKKVVGADGYEIHMATKKNGDYNKVKTIKKSKTIKYTTKKLKKNKKYYFKIRAYKTIDGKKVYSSWSKVKNIKVR